MRHNDITKLFLLFLLAVTPLTRADDLTIDKVGPIDNVGPIDKVGPIDPVGKSKDQKSSPPSSQDQSSPASKNKSTITIQGTGADPVDFSTRTPTNSDTLKATEEDDVDILEKMSLGGHKKEGGGSGSGDVNGGGDDDGLVRSLMSGSSTPNFQDLNGVKVLAPIEPTEKDAPQGMIRVSSPEQPNKKDPRKNFPAQAGGNTAGC